MASARALTIRTRRIVCPLLPDPIFSDGTQKLAGTQHIPEILRIRVVRETIRRRRTILPEGNHPDLV